MTTLHALTAIFKPSGIASIKLSLRSNLHSLLGGGSVSAKAGFRHAAAISCLLLIRAGSVCTSSDLSLLLALVSSEVRGRPCDCWGMSLKVLSAGVEMIAGSLEGADALGGLDSGIDSAGPGSRPKGIRDLGTGCPCRGI